MVSSPISVFVQASFIVLSNSQEFAKICQGPKEEKSQWAPRSRLIGSQVIRQQLKMYVVSLSRDKLGNKIFACFLCANPKCTAKSQE